MIYSDSSVPLYGAAPALVLVKVPAAAAVSQALVGSLPLTHSDDQTRCE